MIYVGDLVDNCSIITIEFLKGEKAQLKYYPKTKELFNMDNQPMEFSKRVLNVEEIKFKPAPDGIAKENALEFCYMLGKENKLKKLLSKKKG